MKRDDDYQVRRQSVANLSDKELEQRFWQLAEQIVDPLLKLGYENTSPAIERSVLLRMGFSSIEAKAIADGCCNITLADLASPELVTDEAFHLITGALLMAKYGDVVLNLEKGADIT